jgi:hypothetical protein
VIPEVRKNSLGETLGPRTGPAMSYDERQLVAPPAPAQAVPDTLPAPFYIDEWVTVYHGDCRSILPLLGAVDHVITDPPYSLLVVNTSARGRTDGEKAKGVRVNATRRDLGYDGVSDSDRQLLGMEIARLTRRWAIVFCDAESLSLWRVSLENGGLRHIRCGAWVSPACTPQFTGDRPGTGWEACEIAHAPGRCRWNGGGSPAVWIVNRPVNGSRDRIEANHPTPKPVVLFETIVHDFTDPGDVILDPYGGSGTTAVAAKRLGRRCIVIEKERAHCETIARRLQQQALDLHGVQPAPAQTNLL